MPKHRVAHVTGDAKSQGRTFHGRCQITESHISREMPNHRVAHFTGDAKSQGRTFHGRCQITGSHISREMPNHRVAHFTGDAKSQGRTFHGRSANYRTGHLLDDQQIAGLGVSRGMLGSSLIVKRFSLFIFLSHCTEDCQITGWRHFTGDRQITGLVI